MENNEKVEKVFSSKWLSIPEKNEEYNFLKNRIHENNTVVNFEFRDLKSNQKTYLRKSNVFFLTPKEEIRKLKNEEILKDRKRVKVLGEEVASMNLRMKNFKDTIE